jgi:tetratricopeptide (TPR) repeat protein
MRAQLLELRTVIFWLKGRLTALREYLDQNRSVRKTKRTLSHWVFVGQRRVRASAGAGWWGVYCSILLLVLAIIFGAYRHELREFWPFYILVVLMGLFVRYKDDFAKYGSICVALVAFAYVIYQSEQPTTAIAPFTLHSEGKGDDLPFSGETVANVVRDGLESIGKVARQEPGRLPCANTRPPSDIPQALSPQDLSLDADLLPVLRAPEATTATQSPEPVTLEVKGVSLNALLSAARALQGSERMISGDVIVDGSGSFSIVARSNRGNGAWGVGPYPANMKGLEEASCALAEYILKDTNPNLLAEAYINSHRSAEAVILYNYQIYNYELAADEQTGHDALMLEGAARMQLANYQDAVNKFETALSRRQNDPVALEAIGLAYVGAKDYDSAFKYFDDALKCPPAFLPCPLRARNYYDRGVAYYYKKDYPSSIRSFQQVVQARPQYAAANFYLGEAFQRTKQYADAIKAYQAAMVSGPVHPFDVAIIQLQLGNAFDLDRQPGKAIDAYQETQTYFTREAAFHPEALEARYLAALMYLRIGTVQQENNFTVHSRKDNGVAYFSAGTDILKAVVSEKPEDSNARTLLARAHILLGNALYANNDTPKAIDEVSEAIDEIERMEEASALPDGLRLFLGVTLAERGNMYLSDHRDSLAAADSAQAIKALSRIHASGPQGLQMKEWIARARDIEAEVQIDEQKYQDAIDTLTRALELLPSYPEANRDLGKAYTELGFALVKSGVSAEKAQQDFAQAVSRLTSVQGKVSDVNSLLGRAYIGSSAAFEMQKRHPEAKAACNEALATFEQDPKMKPLIPNLQKQCAAVGNRH